MMGTGTYYLKLYLITWCDVQGYSSYDYSGQEGRTPGGGFYDPNQYDPYYGGQAQRQAPAPPVAPHRSVLDLLIQP